MRARNEPIKIVSERWDPDEAAWVRGRVSFAASQRVAFHAGRFKDMADFSTLAEAEAQVGHMAAVLTELIDRWTFRDQAVPYEAGVDRPVLPLTDATLAEQDPADITYLFQEAMRVFGTQTAAPDDVTTPAAATEGLQQP